MEEKHKCECEDCNCTEDNKCSEDCNCNCECDCNCDYDDFDKEESHKYDELEKELNEEEE